MTMIVSGLVFSVFGERFVPAPSGLEGVRNA